MSTDLDSKVVNSFLDVCLVPVLVGVHERLKVKLGTLNIELIRMTRIRTYRIIEVLNVFV